MTSTNNHQELIDWTAQQDIRLSWVLTHHKKPCQDGWQKSFTKTETLPALLEGNAHANAVGINLGWSKMLGIDFDADDWPEQFASLAGVTVEEGNKLLQKQTYVVSPRKIADGKTPRLKVLVPFDEELAEAFLATGCKNKVTESKNNGIGLFGGTGVQFAVFGPYKQDVDGVVIEGDYKPKNFDNVRECGPELRQVILGMLRRVAESKAYKAKSPERRFTSDSDVQDLDSAVKFLSDSADDFSDSDSWFMVMCAIRDGGDSCLGLAHEFCGQMHNYDAREIDRRWDNRDFDPQPGGHTKATIFKLAAERGWKNPAKGRVPQSTQNNLEIPSGGTEEPLVGEEELEYDQEQAASELKGSQQQLEELDYVFLMPGLLQAAAKDVWAHRTIAPSMLFPAMLTAASVALGHGHTWRLLDFGDFVEKPRIWALVIAGSGSDKSSVNGLTCGVLKQLDRTDYNDRKNAEDELEAHKRLKGESEAMKVERFEMEKNLAPRRERFISDNASYKGMIETLADGNADGVLHFFDETTEHFRRLADKKSNPDNWNPSAEINLYDGKKTGFRNRGEQVIVEDGFLYNRLANIQPEPLSKVFQLSEGQGTWARWLFFRTAPRRTVLEDFVKSAQAETAFKELWEPIMWNLVQMEGTTWMPATHEDFEAFTEASVGTESMKHDQAPVTKAFYSKARGGLARLVLIFAALRVATYGGTVGEWIGDDVTKAMMLYQGCAEELGSFASKHQDSESRWSSRAKDLLDKPWLREQELDTQLKTADIQRNCKIHSLKAADYKALFEELAGTLPSHFEVWNEGRSGGLVIKQCWYNGA